MNTLPLLASIIIPIIGLSLSIVISIKKKDLRIITIILTCIYWIYFNLTIINFYSSQAKNISFHLAIFFFIFSLLSNMAFIADFILNHTINRTNHVFVSLFISICYSCFPTTTISLLFLSSNPPQLYQDTFLIFLTSRIMIILGSISIPHFFFRLYKFIEKNSNIL